MSLQRFIGTDTSVVENTAVFENMSEDAVASIITIALESACTDDELDNLEDGESEEEGTAMEGVSFEPVLERSIVKLDKSAKKQRAYKMAILQVAKEMDLKEYKQWCTVRKMDVLLMRKMEKRCASKAKAYMREAEKRAKESTRNPIKKAANYLSRSRRNTQKAMAGDTKIPAQLKSQTNAIAAKLGAN